MVDAVGFARHRSGSLEPTAPWLGLGSISSGCRGGERPLRSSFYRGGPERLEPSHLIIPGKFWISGQSEQYLDPPRRRGGPLLRVDAGGDCPRPLRHRCGGRSLRRTAGGSLAFLLSLPRWGALPRFRAAYLGLRRHQPPQPPPPWSDSGGRSRFSGGSLLLRIQPGA